MLPDNSWPYDPPVKLDLCKDEYFSYYHRSKGHNTENCYKLKDVIQDLIDGGKVVFDGLVKKLDHKDFSNTPTWISEGGIISSSQKESWC